MNTTKFLILREEIRKRRQNPQEQRSYEVGKGRQEKMIPLLQELKEGRIIRDFLQTGDLSFQDIMEGIDFFVVYVDDKGYRVIPLSVTGERWIGKHRDRHPEIPVIAVDIFETSDSIKSKIMEAIRK